MRNPLFVRSLVLPLVAGLFCLGLPQASPAGMIGTERVVSGVSREAQIEKVNSALARAQVAEQLVAFGVDPDDVRQRVASLSDSELQMLDTQLSSLPAGAGALEVVGIVFIILIILELLDVTSIFSAL